MPDLNKNSKDMKTQYYIVKRDRLSTMGHDFVSQLHRTFVGLVCFVVLMLISVVVLNVSIAKASGAVQAHSVSQPDAAFDEAITKSSLPWYDPETDGIRTPEIPDRSPSGLEDRHNVPEATVTKPAGPKAGPPSADGALGVASIIVLILGAILLAAVITGLIFAFLKIESGDSGGSKHRKRTSIEDHISRLPFEVEQTTGDFATEAQAAYQSGDYRKAIIYLYGDVLVTLDRESLIRLQKGKTNRQYFREVRRHRELSGFFLNIMTAFEDVFFGQHDVDRQRVDECFGQWGKFHDDVKAIAAKKFAQQAVAEQTRSKPIVGGTPS
jgi:hypothetical protein